MKIQEVMSVNVVTVDEGTSLRELWRSIFSKHINAVPVTDKKKNLIGIITKEDILKSLYPDYQEYFDESATLADFEVLEGKVKELSQKKASDVMSKRVVFTRSDTPIMRALSRMIVRRVDQLPVLSEANLVVGIVTKGDIFYALFKRKLKKPSNKPKKA